VRSSRFPILARLAPATAAALAALAAAPAVGHAASTFGSDLKSPTTIDDGCEGPGTCTRLLFSIDGKDVTSPIDGVVVHWNALGKGTIRLRIVHRDGDTWTAGAVSEPSAVPAGDRGDWDTRLPIKAGDFLAVDGDRNNQVFMAFKSLQLDSASPHYGQAEARYWFPALEPGKESQSILIPDRFYEPLVSAVVEPDADGDGYGDETQDCAPTDAAVHVDPGCDPGTDPGTTPGTDPGTDPGTTPGTDPGTDPGTTPGTDPGTKPTTDPGNGQTSGSDPGSQPSSGGDPTTPSTDPTTTPTDSTTTPPPDGFVYDYYYADPGTAADQWWSTDSGIAPGGYDPSADKPLSTSTSTSSDGSSDSGSAAETAAGGVAGAACVVPKLRGAKVKDAKATLRANGCRVGKVKRAKGRGVKRGRVLRQSRRAGRTLVSGTRINLRVRR
jgi:hypothetical protein